MPRGSIRVAASAILTIALLAALFSRTDLAALQDCLLRTRWAYLGIALALLWSCSVVQALRWRATLRAWERTVPLPSLLRIVMIGIFFSMMLPTAAGGDVARWTLLARRGGGRSLAAQSVAADRLLGLFGLGLMVMVGLPSAWSSLPGGPWRTLILLVGPTTIMSLAAVMRPGWIPGRWRERLGLTPARSLRWIGGAAALAVFNHVLVILVVALLGHALAMEIDLAVHATLVPLVWLASMLPISIGGLGVRETSFVALYAAAGVPANQGAAIAMLWLLVTLANALVGGLVFLVEMIRGDRDRSVASLGDDHQRATPSVIPAPAREG